MNELPDPDWERRHAALFKRLKAERTPRGELESQWLAQIATHALRNDVAAMKIATFAFLRLQFIRDSKDDGEKSLLLEGT